ncbi:Proteasome lid subunit RPN8/RPN11, contains Jab1/MPN metalloenzyme (JAMM) motif [Mariprofundus ferrinatatus]|uniref:Proteasome lid subunit RPN8/RPN11, contains Jab1/MPN metalloenzyme (JAMM) motif n=1 Tax=Mariprofundus ferrinatatus TaxID=1921087 RepID=A0A2K8L295_9PROT|nr:M67 family metallopeptidase [Mariprofundus ferrinatatus]ATX81373.1 Proteasome lid subunit RPN8/RPN11, contains Jab1/MPN metalloenzyme (JAMM) motif [Mariprofundus ferrinatatus]
MTTAVYEPERFRSPEYLDIIDAAESSNRLRIADDCLKAIKEQGESGYPHEICGLLIGRLDAEGWQISEVRQVDNLNSERAADRFELDPAAYQRIDRELRGSGLEIVGVYHSHPDCPAKPSPTDLGSAWEGFAYPIVSICDGKAASLRCWSVNDSGNRFQEIRIQEPA